MDKVNEYETPEQTRKILDEMYYDNFKFWQREKNRGVIKEDVSIRELALRDNKSFKRNPNSPMGKLLDVDAKKHWLDEMENPIILETEIPNAQTPMIVEHNTALEKTIENDIVGDKKGNSYISKEELKEILDSHLNQVQSILNDHKQEVISRNESVSVKDALKESANNFRNALKDKIDGKVEATKESVESVKNEGLDKLKYGIIKVNNSIKDFSKFIDKKLNLQKNNELHWYESRTGKLEIDNQPDNLKLFDSTKGSGGIVAFDEPLTEQQQEKYGLISYENSKETNQDKAIKKKKENESEMEM